MTSPEKRPEQAVLAEALDQLAYMAQGAALLAEMAETDTERSMAMPSILRAVCMQIAEKLKALAHAVDDARS